MREAFRPFTKVVTITGTTKVTIPLVDSSGVSVDANYVQVEALSGGVDGDYFLVSPSGLNFSEPDASFKTASTINNNTSGTPGAAASISTGSVVFSLPPRDTISSIILSQTDGVNTYAITYGVVNVVNALADNRKRVGG